MDRSARLISREASRENRRSLKYAGPLSRADISEADKRSDTHANSRQSAAQRAHERERERERSCSAVKYDLSINNAGYRRLCQNGAIRPSHASENVDTTRNYN